MYTYILLFNEFYPTVMKSEIVKLFLQEKYIFFFMQFYFCLLVRDEVRFINEECYDL